MVLHFRFETAMLDEGHRNDKATRDTQKRIFPATRLDRRVSPTRQTNGLLSHKKADHGTVNQIDLPTTGQTGGR